MIKLSVFYNTPSDPAAFEEHYFGTHMPLVDKMPGLVRTEVTRFTGTMDGKPAPYYIQTDLVFESNDAMGAAFGTSEGQAVVADTPNLQDAIAALAIGEIAR